MLFSLWLKSFLYSWGAIWGDAGCMNWDGMLGLFVCVRSGRPAAQWIWMVWFHWRYTAGPACVARVAPPAPTCGNAHEPPPAPRASPPASASATWGRKKGGRIYWVIKYLCSHIKKNLITLHEICEMPVVFFVVVQFWTTNWIYLIVRFWPAHKTLQIQMNWLWG